MVARHFRIARKTAGINCRHSLLSAKISFSSSFFHLLSPISLSARKDQM